MSQSNFIAMYIYSWLDQVFIDTVINYWQVKEIKLSLVGSNKETISSFGL